MTIGIYGLKKFLFNRLKVSEPGPAYIHIPNDFDEEFFLQLIEEIAVRNYKNRVGKTREWNEALDLAILNLTC